MGLLSKNIEFWMEKRNFNPHSLAAKAELNPNAVRHILSGKVKDPRIDTLYAIADALEITLEELMTGEYGEGDFGVIALRERGKKRSEDSRYLRIPELDVTASAGGGSAVADRQQKVAVWNIPRNYLEAHVNATESALTIIRVKGDSMVPEYFPGDRILVDTSDRTPSDGDFVIVDEFNTLLVKKIQVIMGTTPPQLKIISANKEYSSFELPAEAVTINGKVLGKWQWK